MKLFIFILLFFPITLLAQEHQEDFNLLLDSVSKSIKDFPEDAVLYVKRGAFYRLRGEWSLALADFQKAADLDKNLQHQTFLYRGVVLTEKEAYEEAIALLNQFLQKEPNHGKALLTRGRAYLRSGKYEQGIPDYNRALPLLKDPTAEMYLERSEALMLLETNPPDQAIRGLNEGIARVKKNRVDLEKKALDWEIDGGHTGKALLRVEKVLSYYQGMGKLRWLSLRGDLLAKLKRNAEAMQSYFSALTLIDELPRIGKNLLHTRIQILYSLGRIEPEQAELYYERKYRKGNLWPEKEPSPNKPLQQQKPKPKALKKIDTRQPPYARGLSLGRKDARIIIRYFGDFKCLLCNQVREKILQPLEEEFIRQGNVRVDFLPYDMGRQSREFAKGPLCAAKQNRFWPYHDLFLANVVEQTDHFIRPNPDFPYQVARLLDINQVEFKACMKKNEHEAVIRDFTRYGKELGAWGVPTFLINQKNYTWLTHNGLVPYETFHDIITSLLETGEHPPMDLELLEPLYRNRLLDPELAR